MKTERLYEMLKESTKVYWKGESVERRNAGNVTVTEIFGYDHTNKAPITANFEKIDMVFVDVVVDRDKAENYRTELTTLLEEYPQPDRLVGGPSYIELAPNLEMEQESALRLMALGKTLGLWEVISGKILGATDAETLQMAGNGFLMISGYKIHKKCGEKRK
ncbi:MAG TPA: hypothetical protein VJH92_03275 [Candidatus Nanoarchaeia archaeon]|nr:hypothetical protein [Candidatus Nanoarchaeia archaeon]